jgi:hypothetical protein
VEPVGVDDEEEGSVQAKLSACVVKAATGHHVELGEEHLRARVVLVVAKEKGGGGQCIASFAGGRMGG